MVCGRFSAARRGAARRAGRRRWSRARGSRGRAASSVAAADAQRAAQTIRFVLLISRQGKTRLTKFYQPYSQKDRSKLLREITNMIISRPSKLCNFLEWRDGKVVYKRCVASCGSGGDGGSGSGSALTGRRVLRADTRRCSS
jgi:DNA gyrase/topoisomerase IV subunit A